jgi:hypothetical protein
MSFCAIVGEAHTARRELMRRYISRSVGVRQQRYCAAGICPGGAAAVIQHYHPSALAQRQLFKQTPRVLRNGKSRERRVGERKKQENFVGSRKKGGRKISFNWLGNQFNFSARVGRVVTLFFFT